MLNENAIRQITGRIAPMFTKGAYTADGQDVEVPIFRKEIDPDEGIIRVYLYLTDEHNGTFSEFRLLDENGEVVDSEPYSIEKDISQGMVIAFKYKVVAERLLEVIDKEE